LNHSFAKLFGREQSSAAVDVRWQPLAVAVGGAPPVPPPDFAPGASAATMPNRRWRREKVKLDVNTFENMSTDGVDENKNTLEVKISFVLLSPLLAAFITDQNI